MKKKKKVQKTELQNELTSGVVGEEVVVAKTAKKSKQAADKSPQTQASENIVKKKKKKKVRSQVSAEETRIQSPPEDSTRTDDTKKKKQLKKKRKRCPVDEVSQEEDAGNIARTNQSQAKKHTKDKKSKPSEHSDISDDSFFAGEGDEKYDEKKRRGPDHLHPFKVFVGNLPFAADQDTVRKEFAAYGEIERFDMPLNDQGKATGNAFIYYAAEEAVLKALQRDGAEFLGRALKVRRAERQNKGKGSKGKGKESHRTDGTTVFLGGLSFDLDYDTIKRDFEECGEIEAVRMAKNENGRFKGIAFVVFKNERGVEEALKYNGDTYMGRAIIVRRAAENGKGKGKDGKGKAKAKEASK